MNRKVGKIKVNRLRPQRRRIFLGCEGESERSYGTFLAKLLDDRYKDVHLDAVLLRPGGGDLLTLVTRIRNEIARQKKQNKPAYEVIGLLIDSDLRDQHPENDTEAHRIAKEINLQHIIWQQPCHEALLLRHMDECKNLRPQTANDALSTLQKKWPNYQKGMSAIKLLEKFDFDAVSRVTEVEGELHAFLLAIGFFR
jgi:hypothetical protein